MADLQDSGLTQDLVPTDVAEAAELGFDVLGLRVGAPGAEAARAWLSSLGIPCSEGTDEERALLVTECRDIEGVVPFRLRPFGGDLARVVVEQTFDSTVVSVSIRRRHPAATSSLADYGPTCETITEELGLGVVSGGHREDLGGTGPALETSRWSNERVVAEVELLRGIGPGVMVTERWSWHDTP